MSFPIDQSRDSTSPEHRHFQPGQRVFNGRYELVRFLGAGGMGVVWLAQDTTEDTQVALKFVPGVLVPQQREMQRLRDEVRAGKLLRHPRLVATYSMEIEGGLAAIVMEYVEGETLREKLEDHPRKFFEPEEIEGWIRDIIDGLGYLHKEGKRIHRDLKPANVIVDSNDRALLMDFGISHRIKESLSMHSQAAEPQGGPTSNTLAYASPQQVSGKPAHPSDDIYGLGATIYDLLTGTPPFFRGGVDAVRGQIKDEPPTPLRERRQELLEEGAISTPGGAIPPHWERVILACLAKERISRPVSTEEIQRDLSAPLPGKVPVADVQPATVPATSPVQVATPHPLLAVAPAAPRPRQPADSPSATVPRGEPKPAKTTSTGGYKVLFCMVLIGATVAGGIYWYSLPAIGVRVPTRPVEPKPVISIRKYTSEGKNFMRLWADENEPRAAELQSKSALPSITSTGFQTQLKTRIGRIRQMAQENEIIIPDRFDFGMEEWTKSLPATSDDAARLDNFAEAMEAIMTALLKEGVQVEVFQRVLAGRASREATEVAPTPDVDTGMVVLQVVSNDLENKVLKKLCLDVNSDSQWERYFMVVRALSILAVAPGDHATAQSKESLERSFPKSTLAPWAQPEGSQRKPGSVALIEMEILQPHQVLRTPPP